jgi:hypothetical protein
MSMGAGLRFEKCEDERRSSGSVLRTAAYQHYVSALKSRRYAHAFQGMLSAVYDLLAAHDPKSPAVHP